MIARTLLVTAIAAAALLVGCSEPPQQELNAAKEALEKAKEAGAEAYAPSQLQAAQVSYELALKEISVETRKLPFLRKYDKIIETLQSTASAAQSAQKAVETTKKRISGEAQDLITQTKILIDSLDTLLRVAEKKNKEVGTLPADLDSIRISAMNASTALGTGDLFMAKEKAMEAHGKALATKVVADSLFPPPSKKRSLKR
jgi:DNA repair exonuclease SbcCD ATPase subunit